MKAIFRLAVFASAASLAAWAQGPRGPQLQPPRTGGGLDLTQVQIIEGAITAIRIGFGAQYPSLTVNQKEIKIAPVWFLLDNDFELAEGDRISVTAAPALAPSDPYLQAIRIVKVDGPALTLRDENGLPLWVRGPNGSPQRGGQGTPPRTGSGGVDPATIAEATGAITQVSSQPGIRFPSVTLKLASGALLTVKIGPVRLLLDSDVELVAGETATVKYAKAACRDEFIALSVTDAKGNTVVLRHPDGTPAWD